MVRRLKKDVLTQLPSKRRQQVREVAGAWGHGEGLIRLCSGQLGVPQ